MLLVPALSPARLPEIRKVFALVLSLNQIAFRVFLENFPTTALQSIDLH